ncbi:hypothetical protein DFH08DRAFT_1070403 [Mycena albidolilacea]|uniref:Uncharacterized protein n=1 Tax=Mycena albidolilacea TaxID=1033008 RepID=A0AAD7AT59_9AGAR|nr:hypothetical protein DFH08DRAFT_1070403 [Mycena albidolilacea]
MPNSLLTAILLLPETATGFYVFPRFYGADGNHRNGRRMHREGTAHHREYILIFPSTDIKADFEDALQDGFEFDASTTFFPPVPTLNTASGNLVFEPVESSEGQSWSSCDKFVISLVVVSGTYYRLHLDEIPRLNLTDAAAISLPLNEVFFILIVSLKPQVEVVGIPLRDRHTPGLRPSVRVTSPPAQMSTADSTATLVPHTIPS